MQAETNRARSRRFRRSSVQDSLGVVQGYATAMKSVNTGFELRESLNRRSLSDGPFASGRTRQRF